MAKNAAAKSNKASGPKDQASEPITTQRAYTLRLRGADPSDNSWRDALWATHEAINNGAKVFGDWLLTLRGGLSHELAEPPPPPKGKERTDEETADLRKNRRILLALSWLNVEDGRGAPGDPCRVANGDESESARREKVVSALRGILTERRAGKREIEDWVADCEDSLGAKIREDAVWVNRSAMFDARARSLKGLKHEYAQATIMSFFGPAEEYFQLPDVQGDDDSPAAGSSDGPEFRTLARQWVSTNFGTGDKSDTGQIVKGLRALAKADLTRFERGNKDDLVAALAKKVGGPSPDIDGVRIGVGWSTGRPSKGRLAIDNLPDRLTKSSIETMQTKFAEEADDKESKAGLRDVPEWMPSFRDGIKDACDVPFVGERDHIGEYSVMLDHAARRVSIGHSWIKRAEAERRRFEEDARRLSDVPLAAMTWLNRFVADRTGASGTAADGGYRIRRRAIEEWDEVVKRWTRIERLTVPKIEEIAAEVPVRGTAGAERTVKERARIAAARLAQADDEDGKFGDIQLFEAIAVEHAECVWLDGAKPDSQRLKDYVLGNDARFKQMRFKVPAYRHPDPLRHPVFGDFGNSRWEIEYGVHEAAKVARRERRAPTKRTPDESRLANTWLIRLGLWDGSGVRDVDLRWSSKRLAKDLGIGQGHGRSESKPVTRADRLGCAASGLDLESHAIPSGLFDQKEWNGRLQAPRAQLDALAKHVDKYNWNARAKRIRDRIPWLVTFSAKLECRGPFIEYAAVNNIIANRKGEYYPNSEINKDQKREGHGKLILSRLAGLRVLSVDLGHRYAAACAVWQTLNEDEFKKEIAGHEQVAGSDGPSSLYCHTTHKDPKTGKDRTTIYRRIGNPTLADKSAHPAPWARLDRQFLIKLQGEEKPARKASKAEYESVQQLEADLGFVRDAGDPLPWRVDELMSQAVRTARLALRRHGDIARLAHAFKPGLEQHSPGGGTKEHTAETHKAALLAALVRWYDLATSSRWKDHEASASWTTHIAPRLTSALPMLPDDPDRSVRKRHAATVEKALEPIAAELADNGAQGVPVLCALWNVRWEQEDARWGTRLKSLRRWLTPRGLRARSDDSPAIAAVRKERRAAAQNVGGLSLTRIATIRELYQVQKAYRYRPTPEDLRAGTKMAEKDSEKGFKFGDRTLQAMERMREQRVKQIASRIVEAALGVGRMPQTKGRDRERPQEQVDRPCHAIVIENLRNYLPEEVQTRRENRALMNWSAGKVRKYLEEGCQLHGLHLREVMPNYTSRQCSRTGKPGVRCQDVAVAIDAKTGEVKVMAWWWNKAVTSAAGKGDAESLLLVDLDQRIRTAAGKRTATVRVPRRGGDLFISTCSGGKAIQADLNAAANIGLRALLDPDFLGKWWYVPCETTTGKPAKDKCGGAACLDMDRPYLSEVKAKDAERVKDKSRTREKANAWRDVGASDDDNWQFHAPYWNGVKNRIVDSLRVTGGLT